MIYKNLTINKKIWTMLNSMKKTSRIPNALLFHGNEGIGKEACAIEFAALVTCSSQLDEFACGKCKSCTKILSNNHESIKYIFPLPRGKITNKKDSILKSFNHKTIEQYNRELNLKIMKPYHKIELDNANTILINSIRDIKKEIYTTTTNDSWRIIVIFESEKLCYPNQESANSLLKILEEPPKKTLFILTTSKISLLLDTIKSRCIDLYFPRPSEEYFNSLSNNKTNINLYKLLDANIQNLTNIKDIEVNALEIFVKNFNKLHRDKEIMSINLISEITKLNQSDKKLFLVYIESIKHYYKDLAIIKTDKNSDNLTFNFLKSDYLELNNSATKKNWSYCVDTISNFQDNLQKNLNLNLSMINLLTTIKSFAL
ncbi:MAG: hypothetical protein CMG00_08520 [Candidatus Marinimicrobia bacterium]|nr:hypothetical protein [Candidatus Neomarinimicrobiota bacterium]